MELRKVSVGVLPGALADDAVRPLRGDGAGDWNHPDLDDRWPEASHVRADVPTVRTPVPEIPANRAECDRWHDGGVTRCRPTPHRPELGSVLLGRGDESVRARRVRVQVLLGVALLMSNLVGVVITTTLVFVVLPGPDLTEPRFRIATMVITPLYVAAATLVGGLWAGLTSRRWLRWAAVGRAPSAAERRATLRLPRLLTLVQAVLWIGGVIVITTAFGLIDPDTGPPVGFTIAFAGLEVCCAVYLFAEFGLRPVAAAALSQGEEPRTRTTGTMARVWMLWAVGNGVPFLGLVVLGWYELLEPQATVAELSVVVIVLGMTSLVIGSGLSTILVNSMVGPVRTVRWAMQDLAAGDLDRRVVVFDGSELGDLQRGFNQMAEGLSQRERLRDLFGRHVGQEVARAAELHDPELGGRAVSAAVLFVDIIGSTGMAEDNDPTNVVEVLNEFFAVVVETVTEHGGSVDKFLGDAALAVFGAPTPLTDPAGSALACARAISDGLRRRVSVCRAGIGVSYGEVVAGYVGAHSRFEYTVIGDAVNEASRLSEISKTVPSLVLASGTAVQAATEGERGRWTVVGSQVVRGRTTPTVLAEPITSD